MLAPLVLFVYNRPWHTTQTVNSLRANYLADETDLIIFSDGPKRASDVKAVNDVRSVIKDITGFRSLEIIESDVNKGLAISIIAGVSRILDKFEQVIVLEDDMVTSPYFLTYMNSALKLYKNDDKVISIHGYVYPVSAALPDTFFLKGADCWGWATWRRGWDLFEPNGQRLFCELKQKGLTKAFDFDGSYPYTRMLQKQIGGQNDSWAIRWYASAFLGSKLTLYPGKSLVQNIGNDTSGTHSWNNNRWDHISLTSHVELQRLPLKENVSAKQIIADYLRSTEPNLLKKLISRIKFSVRNGF